MGSLKQEFYKFFHQKSILYITMVLPVLMLLIAFTNPTDVKWMIDNNFGAANWNIFIAVGVGANLFSMEYKNNTLITLLYKNKNRRMIYVSKLVVMLVYSIFLQLLSMILTILFTFVLFRDQYNLFSTQLGAHPLIYVICTTAIISLIGLIFMVTVTFMIASFTRGSSMAIIIGLAIAFFGQSLAELIINSSGKFAEIIRWNPLNMTNVVGQLTFHGEDYEYIHKITHLNNSQMLTGTFFYSMSFLIIGYLVFRRKRI